MADTAVAITAGTGTNIDTRTESTNGHHRQVVVIGDGATNAGIAPVDVTAGLKVDLGADNDITGTVTANLGATDNAVLDAIQAATEATETALETAGGLVVNLGANNDVTVTGTVAVTQSGTWDEVGINDSGNSITIDANGTPISGTNPLIIGTQAIQDTGNSTTATLGSGGNFTGTAFDLNAYSSWSVNIFSDKASSTNGLVIQWSDDGTNWDFSDAITYVASVGNMMTFGRKARYVRLNYTNTNSAQTFFRVTAYAQPIAVRQTRKFIGNQLSDGETGQVVIAGIQGHSTAGGGAWVDVKVNPSGALTADVTATDLDIRNLTATDVVTANLSATDNAVLDAIEADTTTLAGAVSGTEVQVDVLTMPTTTVTATNLDIRDLTSVSDSVAVHGNVGVLDQKDLTNSNPATVAIVDGNGDQITSFGGGTQYTEGDTDVSITGTAMLMEGAGNALVAAQGTAADGLLVNLGTNNDVTVTGSVTANAGTNLNTSTLALETGGNLAEIKTNTDNIPVVGQALMAASTPVVIASNQTAVPVSGTFYQATQPVSNAGTFAVQSTNQANSGVDIGDVTINNASGASAVNIQDGGNTITVDGTVTVGSITAGDNNIGNVDVVTLPALATGSNVIGKVSIDQATPGTTNAVQDIPATSGGLSKFHLVGAATDNATNIKASAGQVYSITAFNLNASPRYLKFHNTAGTPTAGSGVTDTFLIPGNTAGAGLVLNIDKGIAFGTGIGITIVTGIADNNTTAIGASEVVINVYYK